MSYERSIPCPGDAAEAIKAARTILLGQGFTIERATGTSLSATSSWMTTSHQPPLRGVSSIQIEVHGSTLHLVMGQRNLIAMMVFVLLVPPLVAVAIMLTHGPKGELLRVPAILLIVCFLSALGMWVRTRAAINSLTRNMQTAAEARRDG